MAKFKDVKRYPSEAQIQKAFFEWLSYYPRIREMAFAIPNGGSRNIIEASNLKKQGVTAGVPDVFIAAPTSDYNGLFIEFKSKKGKLTGIQKKYETLLKEKGYHHQVCRTVEEGMRAVKEYLTL